MTEALPWGWRMGRSYVDLVNSPLWDEEGAWQGSRMWGCGEVPPCFVLTPSALSPQLAVSVGNTRFNEIMEATLPTQDCPKPSAGSDM